MYDIEIVALKTHGVDPTALDFPEEITTAFPALVPTGKSRFYAIAGWTSLIPLTEEELALLARCKQDDSIVDYRIVERIEYRPAV